MAFSFGFFLDPACTTPIVSALQFVQAVAAPSAADRVVYFGSPRSDRVLQATDSGDIIVTAAGDAAGDIALALTAGGLDTATPGAVLALGSSVAGGAAVPLYLRALDTAGIVGQRPATFTTNDVEEYPA